MSGTQGALMVFCSYVVSVLPSSNERVASMRGTPRQLRCLGPCSPREDVAKVSQLRFFREKFAGIGEAMIMGG